MSFPKTDLVLYANYLPELAKIQIMNLPCKVSNIQLIGEKFAILTLRLPPNSNFNFLPGQYIDLSYQGVTRSYSIASLLSSELSFDLHIRLFENGEFSQLLQALELNQLMRLSGPKGSFFIRESNRPLMLISSGTGFAPIHSMVQNLIERGDEREVYIYWRAKYESYFYIQNPFSSNERTAIKFIPFISGSDPKWHGRKGSLHDILATDFDSIENFDVYACGAARFIQETKDVCFKLQLDLKHFYTDLFLPS